MIGWVGLDIGQVGDPPVDDLRVAEVQAWLTAAGHGDALGRTGPHRDGVDGIAGDRTRFALEAWRGAHLGGAQPRTSAGRIGPYEIAAILTGAGGVSRAEYDAHTHGTPG